MESNKYNHLPFIYYVGWKEQNKVEYYGKVTVDLRDYDLALRFMRVIAIKKGCPCWVETHFDYTPNKCKNSNEESYQIHLKFVEQLEKEVQENGV